jgi:hypothetical protein
MIDLDDVVTSDALAVQVVEGTAKELWNALAEGGPVCRFVRGQQCQTLDDLYSEVAAAFQFPPHFGRNKSAYEDLMRDLSWLKPAGQVVVGISDADWLLGQDDFEEMMWFLEVSFHLNHDWQHATKPATPGVFRLVLQSEQPSSLADMVDTWVRIELPKLTLG